MFCLPRSGQPETRLLRDDGRMCFGTGDRTRDHREVRAGDLVVHPHDSRIVAIRRAKESERDSDHALKTYGSGGKFHTLFRRVHDDPACESYRSEYDQWSTRSEAHLHRHVATVKRIHEAPPNGILTHC
jgi:hypothetical protein